MTHSSSTPHRFPIDALALVVAASIGLLVLQGVTLPKLWPSITQFRLFGSPAEYVTALVELPWSTTDYVLLAALLATGIALLSLELHSRRWTLLIKAVASTETRSRWTVVLGGLVAVRFYFSPGAVTWTADAAYHTLYTWIAGEVFASGSLPVWTPLVAAGTPFLQFYGFVFFYLSGTIYAILDNLDIALKMVLGGAHIASGFTTYLLCRELTRSRKAGLLAAAICVLSFWHTQQILVMGRYPVSLVYAFLPLPFWALSVATRRRTWHRPALVGGSSLALIVLTHPGYGIWAGAFLVGLSLVFYVTQHARRPRILRATIGIIAVGMVLSSVLTVPILLEGHETYLRSGFSLSGLPDPTPSQVFLWSNYNTSIGNTTDAANNWYGGYIGLSAVFLSLIGVGSAFWRPGRMPTTAVWFGAVGGALSLLLMFGYRWPFVESLPFIRVHNAGRYELFLLFFIAQLSGIAASRAPNILNCHPSAFLAGALVIVGLDLLPTTVRQPYQFASPRIVSQISHPLYDRLERQGRLHRETDSFPIERLVHTYPPRNGVLVASTRTPTIDCVYVEHPRAADQFLRPLIPLVEREVRTHAYHLNAWLASEPAQNLLDALYLAGARYHITPVAQDEQNRGTVELTLTTHSPIIVSSKLVRRSSLPTGSETELLNLVSEMEVDRDSHTARQIPVPDTSVDLNPTTSLTLTLQDYRVAANRVRLTAAVSTTCFARLAFSYYSGLDIQVNGNPVEAIPTSDGFTAIRLEPGENLIHITGTLSALRKTLWVIVFLFAAACFVLHRAYRSGS